MVRRCAWKGRGRRKALAGLLADGMVFRQDPDGSDSVPKRRTCEVETGQTDLPHSSRKQSRRCQQAGRSSHAAVQAATDGDRRTSPFAQACRDLEAKAGEAGLAVRHDFTGRGLIERTWGEHRWSDILEAMG